MTITLARPALGPGMCPTCGQLEVRTGPCPLCTFIDHRGVTAVTDAQYRLDRAGHGYTATHRASDLMTVRAWQWRQTRLRVDAATPVNGCAECGRLAADHHLVRGHTYTAPTDRTRLTRLRAHRSLAAYLSDRTRTT